MLTRDSGGRVFKTHPLIGWQTGLDKRGSSKMLIPQLITSAAPSCVARPALGSPTGWASSRQKGHRVIYYISLSLYIYIYICIHIYSIIISIMIIIVIISIIIITTTSMHIYIYIYNIYTYVCIYIYICIYSYTYVIYIDMLYIYIYIWYITWAPWRCGRPR